LSRPSYLTSQQPLPPHATHSIQDNLIKNISNDILNTTTISNTTDEGKDALSNSEEDSRYVNRKLFSPFTDVSEWFTNNSKNHATSNSSSHSNRNQVRHTSF